MSVSPADNTYTSSLAFGSNGATAPFTFTMSWASGPSQITGTGFTLLPASIGTAILYLDFNPSVTVTFTQTPAVTATTTGTFPGTKCDWAVFSKIGSQTQAQWNSAASLGFAEVTPSGNSFTIPAGTLPGSNTVQFQGGTDFYFAEYCH